MTQQKFKIHSVNPWKKTMLCSDGVRRKMVQITFTDHGVHHHEHITEKLYLAVLEDMKGGDQ